LAAIRTFLDANVLINAFRGIGQIGQDARDIIDDPNREFVASDMLRLELIPKAHFHQQHTEELFYIDYVATVVQFVLTTPDLVADAELEAEANGLAAVDALHVTAAKRATASEFITAERSTKPVFRVQGITLTSIRP
jgi:predicted nucleic acid-binding protein